MITFNTQRSSQSGTDYYLQGSNVLGSEEFTDPGFDNAGDWTIETGWAVGSGIASNTAATNLNLKEALALTNGTWYRMGCDFLTHTSGTIAFLMTNQSSSTFLLPAGVGDIPKTYHVYMQATGTGGCGLNGVQLIDGTFDNITIKELTATGAGTAVDPYIGLSNQDFSGLVAGDTLHISGNITEGNLLLSSIVGTARDPIIIQMESGATWNRSQGSTTAIVDTPCIELNNCRHVILQGFNITDNGDDFTAENAGMLSPTVYLNDDNQNIIIQDCTLNNAYGTAILIEQEKNTSTRANRRIFIDDVMIDGAQARGIGLNGHYSSVSNSTLKNIGLKNFDDASAMVVQGGGCRLENNDFINNGDTADHDFAISVDGYTANNANHSLPTYMVRQRFAGTTAGCIGMYHGTSGSHVVACDFNGFNTALSPGTTGKYSAIRIGHSNAQVGAVDDINNTFKYNNFRNDGGSTVASAAMAFGFQGSGSIDGLSITDNDFKDCVQYHKIDDGVSLGSLTVDFNNYYQTDSVYTNRWDMSLVAADGTKYDSLTAWRTASITPDLNGTNDPR